MNWRTRILESCYSTMCSMLPAMAQQGLTEKDEELISAMAAHLRIYEAARPVIACENFAQWMVEKGDLDKQVEKEVAVKANPKRGYTPGKALAQAA